MASKNNRSQDLASHQNTADRAPTSTNSTTALLRTDPSTTMYDATTAPQRPPLQHAQTLAGTRDTATAAPNLSRPILTRAATTTAVAIPRTTNQPATRPGLIHRISSRIDNALELSTQASYAHRNRPSPPSHWTDHAHRDALLKTWDSVHEAAVSSQSRYPRSVIGQLVATEKSVVLQFPELAEGEVVLGREWMEYVLGVSLRQPFCAEGNMGK
jgi:hypothetical protein